MSYSPYYAHPSQTPQSPSYVKTSHTSQTYYDANGSPTGFSHKSTVTNLVPVHNPSTPQVYYPPPTVPATIVVSSPTYQQPIIGQAVPTQSHSRHFSYPPPPASTITYLPATPAPSQASSRRSKRSKRMPAASLSTVYEDEPSNPAAGIFSDGLSTAKSAVKSLTRKLKGQASHKPLPLGVPSPGLTGWTDASSYHSQPWSSNYSGPQTSSSASYQPAQTSRPPSIVHIGSQEQPKPQRFVRSGRSGRTPHGSTYTPSQASGSLRA